MTATAMKYNLRMADLEMVKLKRAKFALLAKVGHNKRVASQFQDEAIFYCSIATELLAGSTELVLFLQELEKHAPALREITLRSTSRLHHCLRQLLRYWPANTESQTRILNLLDSPGLDGMTGITADGYLSLSSDQILANVARVIAVSVSKEPRTNLTSQRTSSDSTTRKVSVSAGTSGDEQAAH